MKSIIASLFLAFAVAGSGVSAAEFTDAPLADLGRSYAQAINDLDADALNGLVSARHLAQNIAEFAGDSDAEKQQLLSAFIDAVPTINERMLLELERQGTTAVFLRVHELDGLRAPLVRYAVGDGYNYVLLQPVKITRTGRGTRIGDLYFATNGEWVSESIGIAAKLASSPSESFLGKLFGVEDVNQDIVSRFEEIGRLRQQNKMREAYDVLDQMQGSVRNHRLVLMNAIQISAQIDEGLYRKELQRLAKHHKDDPRAAFTLLDHYFYENDVDAAMSIIDLMEETYGLDSVFYLFRANLETMRGRKDAALGHARRAVELEPGNEDSQWTLLTVLVESEMYREGVTVLQFLENEFGYAFAREDFQGEPMYADFVMSGEFAGWIDAR